jgi:plastocyanin
MDMNILELQKGKYMRLRSHKIVTIAAFALLSILLVQWNQLSNAAGQPHGSESTAAHPAHDTAPVKAAEKATAANEVIIDNFAFAPASLTVSVGATVTWTNRDDDAHQVYSTNDLFKSSPMDTNDKFSFEFKAPGTYPYYCKLHPQMKGQIVVQ